MRGNRSGLRIGDRVLDPVSGELRGGTSCQRLEPKVVEVLLVLVEKAGEVVDKEEILARVWGETAVTDDVLWRCIRRLRKAFGDSARHPRFLETLPRRGYRWLVPAEVAAPSAPEPRDVPPPAIEASPPPQRSGKPSAPAGWRRSRLGLPALLLAVAFTVGLFVWSSGIDRAVGPGHAPEAAVGAPPPQGIAGEPPAPGNGDARQLYELGQEHFLLRDVPNLERALELFQRSIEADESYAPGYAGVAAARVQLSIHNPKSSYELELAREAAQRALALAPALPEAHRALGTVYHARGWLHRAIPAYEKALELEPELRVVRHNLAALYRDQGRPDLAIPLELTAPDLGREVEVIPSVNLSQCFYLLHADERARELALEVKRARPGHPLPYLLLAQLAWNAGDVEAAGGILQEGLEILPGSLLLLHARGKLALAKGDRDGAESYLLRAREAYPLPIENVALLQATLLGRRGDPALAEGLLRQVEARLVEKLEGGDESWQICLDRAAVHVLRDQPDAAMEWLEQAARQGFLDGRGLAVDPLYEPLRSDARFLRLLEGLQETVAGLRRKAGLG